MSFWSDFFSKKKDDKVSQHNNQSSNGGKESKKIEEVDAWNYGELIFDNDDCVVYPNGLKLYYVHFTSFNDIDAIRDKLGYYDGETFFSFHDSKGKVTLSDDVAVWGVWELFTNTLLCLVTREKKILKRIEIEQIESNARNEWKDYRYDGRDNCVSLLVTLGEAVTGNSSISQQFIERVFGLECVKDVLDVEKFHFEFKDGMLYHCMYDGYDVFMFSTNTLFGIGLSEIEDYHEYANKTHRTESTMKKIINYQAHCLSHIDDDILDSEISKEKFGVFTGMT